MKSGSQSQSNIENPQGRSQPAFTGSIVERAAGQHATAELLKSVHLGSKTEADPVRGASLGVDSIPKPAEQVALKTQRVSKFKQSRISK